MEPIAAVRAALPREIPVVGNGDVKDVAAYQRMKRETGCDAVMIGRGAMGNPWLFRTLAALEQGAARSGPADAGGAPRRLAPARRAGRRAQPREDAQARAAQDAGLVLARPLRRARRCASARRPSAIRPRWSTMGEAFFAELERPRAPARRRRARDDAGRSDRQVGRPQQPPRRPPRRGRGTVRRRLLTTHPVPSPRGARWERVRERGSLRVVPPLRRRRARRSRTATSATRSTSWSAATMQLVAAGDRSPRPLPPRRDPADRDRDAHVGADRAAFI